MASRTSAVTNHAPSLPEFVYGELRSAILNGVFAPGETLRQEDVAARLGVSRSPLREALPRLEAEGIVVLRPRRGYAVAELRAEEIREVFDLRILLECEIAGRAIQKRTEADIARVYEIAGQMRALGHSGSGEPDFARWADLNVDFHDALLAPARMPHYMRALNTARGGIEAYIRTELRLTGNLSEAQNEHSQLAQAFVGEDAEKFVSLIRQHSVHTRDRLLAGLSARNT